MASESIHPFSFPKSEHLCGEIRIGKLFASGTAFITYPFRVVYAFVPAENEARVSVLITVPKKRFKRAVKRNKLKRQTREAYRRNKQMLTEALALRGLHLHLAFGFVANDMPAFKYIDRKMQQALQNIINNLPEITKANDNEAP